MKIRPAKEAGKVVMEINPVTEPRIAEAFFGSLQGPSSVRIKKILATTDFSELSLQGVHYAISLSEEFDAALALVNVVEPTVNLGGMESVVIGRSDDQVVELEKRRLAMLAKKLSKKGRPIRPVTRYGKAFREITELAGELKSDLIVTTTHGYSGLKRVLIGSTAEWMVRYAPCPVLTVPTKTTSEKSHRRRASAIKKILVPIDFSETSTKALPYAAALAEVFDAGVLLVYVTETRPMATIRPQVVQLSKEMLLRVQREVFSNATPTQTVVVSGSPFDEITKAALRYEADLIVLNTHGRTGLKRVLLGSTAERVIRHSPCPVMVVRDTSHR